MNGTRKEETPIEITIDCACVNAKPPLRALADVTLRFAEGELTIRRCAVFEKSGAPPWASLPRLPIEKNGKRNYAPLIDLPRDLKQRVLDAVLEEYRKKKDARSNEFPWRPRAKEGATSVGPDDP
jgi:hypothetical protein